MGAVNHVVHAFGLIVDGKIRSVVVSQTHARHEVGSVYFVTVQDDRSHVCNRQSVELSLGRALECTGRSLSQIIAVSGLVVDDADVTDCSFQEGILRGSICISSGNCTDIKCLAV